MRLRSDSVVPAQTPSCWRVAGAKARHAARTGADAHTESAGAASSSDSGKKMSVSRSRQAASARQVISRDGKAVLPTSWSRDQRPPYGTHSLRLKDGADVALAPQPASAVTLAAIS